MPKVTDEYRIARRTQIARAAVICIQRHGFAGMSMADIIAESGTSAGAIYSHFASKADIVRFMAEEVVAVRLGELAAGATERGELDPLDTLEFVLKRLLSGDPPLGVLVQLWAGASADDELRAVVGDVFHTIRAGLGDGLLPWARRRAADEAAAHALASRTAATIATIAQGYAVSVSLGGPTDPHAFVTGVRGLFDSAALGRRSGAG